ncbi:peptidoglycan-binding domain-containing protein [Terribacillus saccharophilus]|nr:MULTISPECIES: peptidoglycan-binding domain-containing protein [Terribacillus]MCM3224846.1 peptidoglycan-binding protein [Terribacillus saccharophilus]MEC0302755.1 peptidoglycan-binding domain-containing protein [Terribacillus saccharophilus]
MRRIQRALGVTADGIFGPNTRQAVINFQRNNGLGVDGIVGQATWNRLF